MEDLKCPFCGGEVSIVVYENNPWRELGYVLYHDETQTIGDCPIAKHKGEGVLGMWIYDTREEAVQAWNGESEE